MSDRQARAAGQGGEVLCIVKLERRTMTCHELQNSRWSLPTGGGGHRERPAASRSRARKGTLSTRIHNLVELKRDDSELTFSPRDDIQAGERAGRHHARRW